MMRSALPESCRPYCKISISGVSGLFGNQSELPSTISFTVPMGSSPLFRYAGDDLADILFRARPLALRLIDYQERGLNSHGAYAPAMHRAGQTQQCPMLRP